MKHLGPGPVRGSVNGIATLSGPKCVSIRRSVVRGLLQLMLMQWTRWLSRYRPLGFLSRSPIDQTRDEFAGTKRRLRLIML